MINFIKELQFFSRFSEEEFNSINELIQLKTYQKNDVIYEKDDEMDKMFVINTGNIVALQIKEEHDNSSDEVCETQFELSDDDYFGDNALLFLEPSPFRIMAKQKTEISYITYERFHDLLQKNHHLSYKVLLNVTQILKN